MANVFVSHRGNDLVEAERLAGEIRNAGHHVWLDTCEIGVGDSIVEQINKGLSDVEYVVLCYSSLGVETPWISREWMSALARQLEGQGVKLLPVLLPGGSAPAILSDIRHADLSADWPKGLADLLRAIR